MSWEEAGHCGTSRYYHYRSIFIVNFYAICSSLVLMPCLGPAGRLQANHGGSMLVAILKAHGIVEACLSENMRT